MAARGRPYPFRLQHPERVHAPPGFAASRRHGPQVQPMEEGPLEDALEVEEEEDPSSSAEAQEDAPALQVGSWSLIRAALQPFELFSYIQKAEQSLCLSFAIHKLGMPLVAKLEHVIRTNP